MITTLDDRFKDAFPTIKNGMNFEENPFIITTHSAQKDYLEKQNRIGKKIVL